MLAERRRHAAYRVAVPGAFEIPAAIGFAARGAGVSGVRWLYLALGCVIRGQTTPLRLRLRRKRLAQAARPRGATDGVALGYGILTCDTAEQAWVRARVEEGNKGAAAARACLAMIALKARFAAGPAA